MNMRSILALSAAAMVAISAPAMASNLVVNGDFSAGNSGFTSDYTYVAPAGNALYPEGLYTIGANPISVHDRWVDLGASTRPLMIINGATTADKTVWKEASIEAANGAYNFSAAVMDICCNSSFGSNGNAPSKILFQVDTGSGWTDVASYTTAPGIPAQSGDSGILETISGSFNVTNGSFSIRAVNPVTAAGGNDFAITDISVTGAPEPAAWALMMIGVGGMGVALRTRRRNVAA